MKNNLSALMGAKRVRISDLHQATGISRTTLSALYHERATNVGVDILQKVCDYLQVPLSELIEYVPEQKEVN